MPTVPVIENIHQRVFAAITAEGCALEMSDWHKDKSVDEEGAYCGTTHCRAGWVVALAGKAGKKLEEHTSTEFAAMQIYHESSPIRVSPVRFYENNETAYDDIKRCAEEEFSKQ